MKNIVIHYSEIGLKKGNRGFFEKRLKDNILAALSDCPIDRVKMDFGRFVIYLTDQSPLDKIIARLRDVIGIAHISPAFSGDLQVDVLKEQVFDCLKQHDFHTFAISTRRADKNYPLTSVEVNKIVGERIHTGLQKPVNLDHPDLVCTIEIFNKKILFHCERIAGRRGLPVGSSGKVVCLLSSGIDSPVAAYRMMTRGCKVIFVHFHSFPFTEKTSYHNALALAQQLTRFQYQTKIYLAPLAVIQQAIIESALPKLRLILYRRMMFRLAQIIARKEEAKALVTGESLGQVASQTLENITATSEVTTMPIFRPLIGMDKEEIIAQAKALGTFSTSIEPYDDCCSYLVTANPETKAKLHEVHAAEDKMENWQDLLSKAMAEAEMKIFQFPD